MTQGHDEVTTGAGQAPVYSPMARRFHWITVAAVFVMVPLGFAMSYRGNTLNIWDGVTDALYSSHKLIGFLLLWLTAGRLIYRLVHGAPPDEPTLEWWQKAGSHLLHWALYGLLLIVPLLGWIGVSLFPSLMVFNLFGLPPLASPDEVAAKRVLAIHGWLAILLALLVCAHIGAALFHHVIRKDGVLRRMLPSVK
ncbi:MAG: cytochrome B [Stutzerimonas stutzeri]|uniref:Cytochrome b n=1 Tax=Bosea eneae TaxID=151454 RepID=A0ABW0IMB5_9HYPH|nr:MAG: cytochrome B [Stutzerimonas stutzeri]